MTHTPDTTSSTPQDVAERLSKWKDVKMPFNTAGLTAREKKLALKLIEASQLMDEIFWKQSDPEGQALSQSLANSTKADDIALRKLIEIQGGRFDLIDENATFVGTEPAPPGRGLYPKDLSREEIEAYVAKNPEKKEELYNPYTVIERRGDELVGVPYHEAYADMLAPVVQALRDAATLSDDKAFAEFLEKRADALLTDDYFESDMLWMDLKNPRFDVVFAPYEVYLDGVLGVKGSYGSAVLLRNEEESQKLAVFQKYIPLIQDSLPIDAQDRPSKEGKTMPMEVMDSPYRAGDMLHGYQAIADNLPNDPRIHAAKGTKKIFFKNFMDARVDNIVMPLANALMLPEQAAQVTGEGVMTAVLLHEISHGLGPVYSRKDGQEKDIKECIGPVYSALEEAKADVTGMFAAKVLTDIGVLSQEQLNEAYASYTAHMFRSLRFGVGEAHGRAQMMEFNVLTEEGALIRDDETGRYRVDYARMPAGFARITQELLEIEATGDSKRAEKWFDRYDKMPKDLEASLDKLKAVPVDLNPQFEAVKAVSAPALKTKRQP